MATEKAKGKAKPQSEGAAPSDVLTATVTDAQGNVVGTLLLVGKVFSTGNTGYFGTGKVAVQGVVYQAQAQLARVRAKTA